MANELDAIMTKVLARGLMALREKAIMPRLVNSDFSNEFAQKGTTVDVPIPGEGNISDVVPSNTPPVPGDITHKTVPVTLDNWKKSDFHLTDLDMQRINRDRYFVPMAVEAAVIKLANTINDTVHATYVDSFGYAGDPTYDPFSTVTNGPGVKSATNLRAQMQRQLFPRDGRRAVLDFTAEAEALALPQFSDAEKVMSSQVKIEGEIGRKFGIDWLSDNAVKTHTAGTLADGTVNGAHGTPGVTTVSIASTAGGTLVKGDIIEFAGHAGSYVVTAAATIAATGNAAVGIYPALRAALADDEAVSVLGDHVVNLGFQRDAIALAMRPLNDVVSGLPQNGQMMTMTDPLTGIPLRLEVTRQYKQVVWEFDILWGVKMVRPELVVRLPGKVA